MYGLDYVPDNHDQYKRHEAEQEQADELLPRCSMCYHKIYDEKCWQFGDEPICDECAWENFRVDTANLIE